ncbi:MAG: transcriptional repressor [Sphaerochaetaceae bacterium]|nr:transcriptional repressor [Sphaerochaetaceae bacterium]
MERRNTIQKQLVLDAVSSLACHATAEEVYAFVAKDHPSVGKGTVYRNLNILASEGAILKIEVPGKAEHFDHNVHSHYHVVCVNCARMFDVDMEPLSDMKQRIRNTNGIDFLDYDLVFKGICPNCKR